MNAKKLTSTRDLGLDALRATATVLVIVGHVIQFTNPQFDNSYYFKFIYAFHMPLFMCISGYLAPKETTPGFLKQKFKQLVIPFLIWSAIIVVVRNHDITTDSNIAVISELLLQVFIAPDTGLWFLWVLFFNFAAFTMLEGPNRIKISLILIGILYVLQFTSEKFSFFGLNLFRWHYLFFLLGFIFKQTNILYMTKKYLWLIFIITFLTMTQWERNAVTSIFGLVVNSQIQSKLLTIAIKYMAAIGFILIAFNFKKHLQFNNSIISFIANHSLGYYGAQFVFLAQATLLWQSHTIFNQLAVFTFTIAMSSIVILLLDSARMSRQHLLGKS